MTHNDHDNCYQIHIKRAPNNVEFFLPTYITRHNSKTVKNGVAPILLQGPQFIVAQTSYTQWNPDGMIDVTK